MIKPVSKTIDEILSSPRANFSVPNYQRSFDWGRGELQELIDDLRGLQGKKHKELFLGNFIFDVSDSDDQKIVDGQQRLTTISLIFIAIREQAKKLNELDLAYEVRNYLSSYSIGKKINRVKFKVSSNIRDIFDYMAHPDWKGDFPENINGKSIKRQINKVKPIYNFVRGSLSQLRVEELIEFYTGLLKTYVVVLEVEDNQDIFSVFERTNARGLDLNIGDLLKNYIFSAKQDEFVDKWSEIVDNANGSLPRVLKYFWISRKGYIQQSNLYRSIKDYVKVLNEQNSSNGMRVFVDELHAFSRYYKTTQSLEAEVVREWLTEFGLSDLAKNEDYYHRINRVFQALKFFKVTQAYPLIYSIFVFYKASGTKAPKMLFKVLDSIEKYHFVNNVISGRVGNEVEKFYAETAVKIYDSKEKFQDKIESILTELRKKRALKDEFASNFIDSVVYSKYNKANTALINYVFDRINNHDGKGSSVKGAQYVSIFSPEKDMAKRNFNIEHFLSQNDKKKFSDDEQEEFNKIGNLLVISRHTNSELQHKSPKEKVKILNADKKHTANLRYFEEFLKDYKDEFDNWNLSSINKRSDDIAKEAYNKIWAF